MRVVYVNPNAGLGGAEYSLLDLLWAVGDARPGVERHLITSADGLLNKFARELGVQVHPLPLPPILATMGESGPDTSLLALGARTAWAAPQAYSYARRLRRVLMSLSPDIVHSNGIKTHLLLALARPRGVPVIWHLRDFLGSRAFTSKLMPFAARGATAAIAISEAVREDALGVLRQVPIHTVLCGIDVARFTPGFGDGALLDQAAALPPAVPGTLRVGLVATYAHWKGQLLLLDAAARLTARRPDLPLRYFIVGGPIYSTAGSQISAGELTARIVSLGLRDRAGLVPFRPEPVEVFRALDLVVHASTNPEPFGRTIVEGMACGRPVIVSREGGAAELFKEDYDAVSFPPRDAESLSRQIEALATDPARRQRLGEAARCSAVERFSRRRVAAEVLEIYDQLKGGSGIA